jgi:hypothetical protein
MTPELAAAVENAYRVFARYDLRGGVAVCRCNVCVSPQMERRLNTIPLRELPASVLAEYTHSAHGFDGKVESDLRHYLPRYFELIAADDPPTTIDEQICLQRLQETGYSRNWGPQEAGAVDSFFLALLRARLGAELAVDAMGFTGFRADKAEAALCMAAYAGADLSPLLAAWREDKRRTATLHLANVVATANWRLRQLWDSWWIHRDYTEPAMDQVIRWLLQPAVRERLEAAFLVEREEGPALLLSHAESIVAGLI